MKTKLALLFPGQGSQVVGMGRALAESSAAARRTFEEADAALSFALQKLCFDGPEEDLKKTENTQPAILTTSVAALRALRERRPDLEISIAAGHSLGEWSALVAVGALRFEDAVRSVRERGRLMQEAVPIGAGAMSAVLGLEPEKVAEICASIDRPGSLVRPANYNSPEQTVISGHAGAVARAGEALTAAGAKRVAPLAVSAPFHCPLMVPAAEGLKKVLEPIEVGPMSAPVVSNVTAEPNGDPARVKQLLVEQVTSPVRWIESVRAIIASGAPLAIELGPGKVLTGLARRIDRALKVVAIEDPESLAKTLETIGS